MVWCCGDKSPLCYYYDCDKKKFMHLTSWLQDRDICQEAVGYFFCREDRALLCSRCDFAVHSLNINVSSHQRFLFTGVKVGSEPMDHIPATFSSVEKCGKKQTCKMVQKTFPGEHGIVFQGRVSENIQERQLNDIFGNTAFGKSNFVDKPGDNEVPLSSMDDIEIDPGENLVPVWRVDANLDADDNLVQAWVAHHLPGDQNSLETENLCQGCAVPELTSALDSGSVFVPDISYSLVDNIEYPFRENGSSLKRKRLR